VFPIEVITDIYYANYHIILYIMSY